MAAKGTPNPGKHAPASQHAKPQQPAEPELSLAEVPMGNEVPALNPDEDVPSAPAGPEFQDEGASKEPTVILNFVRAPGEDDDDIPKPAPTPTKTGQIPTKTGQIPKPAQSKIIVPTIAPTPVPQLPTAETKTTKTAALNFYEIIPAVMLDRLPDIVLNLFKNSSGWKNVPDDKIRASPAYQKNLRMAIAGYEDWQQKEHERRVEHGSYRKTAENATKTVQELMAKHDEERKALGVEKKKVEELWTKTHAELSELEAKLNEQREMETRATVAGSQAKFEGDYTQQLAEVEAMRRQLEADRAAYDKDHATLADERSSLTALVQDNDRRSQDLDAQKASLDIAGNTLESARKSYEKKQAALDEQYKALEAAKAEFARSKEDADTVTQKILDDDKKIEARYKELDTARAAYDKDRAALDEQNTEIAEQRELLQKGIAEIALQETALNKEKRELAKSQIELDELVEKKTADALKKYDARFAAFLERAVEQLFKPYEDGAKKALSVILETRTLASKAAQSLLAEYRAPSKK